ncbi:glutamyl-tRNA amidotransferase [Candidatus Kuenenbacteria bacterium CG10_big_fil_rev_8_21_14_0_10_36_11]|uniref:Glutamyl-tRNA amidotransferase n=1 Tax=Candidatus Kuenenbacteria bacterium CG10_big_fil_rev_8_21_14_0_10_36_11 TaxID=1974618 RepID=A0A2M6WAB5_9BACT|nr:MAG: glutamyl-tRNA amidotransferase [Candidatus Kuenenbacteria bacterium CG10_big_fil_rev_8_21_14_0_10_36_11]
MLTVQIYTDLKLAMKNKDVLKVSVLRMLIAAFNNEAINLMKKDEGLSDEEAIKVLKKEAKKRKDSIEQFTAGNRPELAKKENEELKILSVYLPAEMSEEDLKKIVAEVIAEMGEVSPSQFGMVMKAVMAKTAGKADGGMASKVVKEVLK